MNFDEKTDRIKHLESKKRKQGLNPVETKEYCKLNEDITGYPARFFTDEFGNKLNQAISDADKLIKKYKKK